MASMRPRPEGRGERPHVGIGEFVEFWLQCGHDPKAVENDSAVYSHSRPHTRRFNAATTRRPWRTSKPEEFEGKPPPLQCGHDPKAVENDAVLDYLKKHDGASMRPRPEGRGEQTKRCRRRSRTAGFNAATTRRPWRTCAAQLGAPANRLGFNAATTRRPWRTPASASSKSCPRRRFNAATTRRPWRTAHKRRRRGARLTASMRPRPEGRGERVAARRQHAPA